LCYHPCALCIRIQDRSTWWETTPRAIFDLDAFILPSLNMAIENTASIPVRSTQKSNRIPHL